MCLTMLCAQCCACSILCASTSAKLQAADVGSFYKLQANLLREALRPEGAAVEAGSVRRSCPGLEVRIRKLRWECHSGMQYAAL